MGFGSFGFSNPLSGVGNYLKREWDSGGDYLTKMAKRNKMDKPGGSVKSQITDVGRDWSQKISHHVLGSAYPGSGGNGDSGTSQTEQDAIDALNYSSRRGNQGKGKNKRVGSEDMRRQPYAMNTRTLLTQGQKAKKLS